jgi:hypothetical protein
MQSELKSKLTARSCGRRSVRVGASSQEKSSKCSRKGTAPLPRPGSLHSRKMKRVSTRGLHACVQNFLPLPTREPGSTRDPGDEPWQPFTTTTPSTGAWDHTSPRGQSPGHEKLKETGNSTALNDALSLRPEADLSRRTKRTQTKKNLLHYQSEEPLAVSN